MSGIAGIVRFDGAPVERELIEKMTAAMAYRGPDGVNHFVRGSIALGHCMLRTTPHSLHENQPLSSDDEAVTLVMDGRVDNWEDLRREVVMRGARLRGKSDAELVLRAYEIWGADCLGRIDGDFALAIWDERRREIFCARDRIGVKPFHYHWDGKTLVFASDLHAILALPWVPRTPNEGMLAEVMADEWYTRDETLWLGVMRLTAAHCMSVGGSAPLPRQYWAPDPWATLPCSSDDDYFAYYRDLLTESVRRRSRSHRELACEVSGGLDSSALFCLADSLERQGRLLAPGLEGYTVDFSDDAAANELSYARAAGAHVGRTIHEVSPTFHDIDWFAERAAAFLDMPGAPNGVALMGLHEHSASRGARVVLSGAGGDHFLSGSRVYYAEELAQHNWRKLNSCLRADVKASGFFQAVWLLFRYGLAPLLPPAAKNALRALVSQGGAGSRSSKYWLSSSMTVKLDERRSRLSMRRFPDLRFRSQQYLLEALYYPPDDWGRVQSERLDASFGVETRVPFYDHRFVQFAVSTPERLRLRGHRDKFIHVEALRTVLPPVICERVTKADFSNLFRMLFAPRQKALVKILSTRADWIEPRRIAELFESYVDNPRNGPENWILWGILCADLVMPRSR
ncbi:asparagine synthase (glutamine-hydrolyzing) [Methylocystis sp. WRRC1]|uniref:asparagine synthase (glutamine-hydrolyzing) n=1 Tax=Methylocystis sp. WRRC1 TaxID=1732014 RepID=UPI001D13814F|nr:asparagine synthase (glutamine-hydrolyzing) [Methylocystis sp. WRRC1]MCC3244440.1 asparagine synthase (glutamine-hydrolyzing) [Methylocystis sp. WRRC1]